MPSIRSAAREQRDQIRSDVREERMRRLTEEVPKGSVRLDTKDVPTTVPATEVAEVRRIRPRFGCAGEVTLVDGRVLLVRDAAVAARDIREASRR